MKGGGYDPIVRGEVGVAVWWVVLFGAAVGVLPAARITAGGLGHVRAARRVRRSGPRSGSAGRTRPSAAPRRLGAVAAYLGVFVIALIAQRGEAVRRTVIAVGAAIAVVSVARPALAAAPGLVPRQRGGRRPPPGPAPQLPARLLERARGADRDRDPGGPLDRGHGPPRGRPRARRRGAAGDGASPPTTRSRAAARIEIAAALIVLFALYPRRLQLLPIAARRRRSGARSPSRPPTQRGALADGLTNAAAGSQASEMLALALVICAGVGADRLGDRARRAPRALSDAVDPPEPRRSTRARPGRDRRARSARSRSAPRARSPTAGTASRTRAGPTTPRSGSRAPAATAATSTGRRWSTPPRPSRSPGSGRARSSSGGRARAPARASSATPTRSTSRRSASSGSPALLLIVALMLAVLGWGRWPALRAPTRERRALLAAATAGCVVFAVAAGDRLGLGAAGDPRLLPVARGVRSPRSSAPAERPERARASASASGSSGSRVGGPDRGRDSARRRRLDPRQPGARRFGAARPGARRGDDGEEHPALRGDPEPPAGADPRARRRSRRPPSPPPARRPTTSRPTGATGSCLSRLEARVGNVDAVDRRLPPRARAEPEIPAVQP